MKKNANEVKVGVGVIVIRDGQVLLGLRHGSHGEGTWGPPGGHLEYGEGVSECAAREVAEETGLTLSEIWPAPYTNDVFQSEGLHYVTLFVVASCDNGEVALLEPDKCSAWQWFNWNNLPAPLFPAFHSLQRTGFSLGSFLSNLSP